MIIQKELREKLQALLSGGRSASDKPLVLGSPAPVLAGCGVDVSKTITITKKVLVKAMRPEIRDASGRLIGNTGHGLSLNMVLEAIIELDNPAMIFKGNRIDSLLVITAVVDGIGRNIVVALELNHKEGFTEVNSIRSLYGRDNLAFFIEDNKKSGKLLAHNKEKADNLLRSIGK